MTRDGRTLAYVEGVEVVYLLLEVGPLLLLFARLHVETTRLLRTPRFPETNDAHDRVTLLLYSLLSNGIEKPKKKTEIKIDRGLARNSQVVEPIFRGVFLVLHGALVQLENVIGRFPRPENEAQRYGASQTVRFPNGPRDKTRYKTQYKERVMISDLLRRISDLTCPFSWHPALFIFQTKHPALFRLPNKKHFLFPKNNLQFGIDL